MLKYKRSLIRKSMNNYRAILNKTLLGKDDLIRSSQNAIGDRRVIVMEVENDN